MRARITNRMGTWEFELHEDGRADLVSFAKTQPLRGLGDVIAAATKAVGIQPCPRCKRTQEQLNRAVPFGSASAPLGLAHGQANHDEQKRPNQEDSAAAGPEVHK